MTLAQEVQEYDGPEETYEQMVVTTDNKWKDFQYRHDVPDKILRENFAHLKDEYDGFFHYRDAWYHISDFSTFDRTLGGKRWDGYAPDTYFSGVLIRIPQTREEFDEHDGQYLVGRYYS